MGTRQRSLLLLVCLVAVMLTLAVVMVRQEGRPQGRPSTTRQAVSQSDPCSVHDCFCPDDPSSANHPLASPFPFDPLSMEVDTPEKLRAVVHYCTAADHSSAPGLQHAALDCEDPLVAGNAIRALGRLGLAGGNTGIPELLSDPRPRIRQEAVIAMGRSGDSAAVEHLVPLIRDEDSTLRALAIQALGRLGGPRGKSLVQSILSDSKSTAIDRAFARAALSCAATTQASSSCTISPTRTLDTVDGKHQ